MFESVVGIKFDDTFNEKLDLVSNSIELEEIKVKLVKGNKLSKILLLIGIVFISFIFYMSSEGGNFKILPIPVIVIFGIFYVALILGLIATFRYDKSLKNNYDNYKVYRVDVELTNKYKHSDDDGTDYYCDFVNEYKDIHLKNHSISFTAYKYCDRGYLYVLVDDKDKKHVYLSNDILDGRPANVDY